MPNTACADNCAAASIAVPVGMPNTACADTCALAFIALIDRMPNTACACRRVDSEHCGVVQLQGFPLVPILYLLGVSTGGLHATG